MADQWFPWYHGDYLRDTKSLSLTEHGAYLMLIGEQYTTEQPLPSDWNALYRIAGAHTDAERQAVMSVVDKFWIKDLAGGLVQRRVMSEVEKRQRVKERNTRIARERYQTDTRNTPDEHEKDTSTSTSTSTSTPTATGEKSATATPPRSRDEVWEAVLLACGIALSDTITPSQRKALNAAVKDIKVALGPNPDVEEVFKRADRHRAIWPKIRCTPSSLARHWSEVQANSASMRRRVAVQTEKLPEAAKPRFVPPPRRPGEGSMAWLRRIADEAERSKLQEAA